MNPILKGEGSLRNIGLVHGERFSPAVRSNLRSFWSWVEGQGIRKKALTVSGLKHESAISSGRLEEIEGIARGAKIPYPEVLAYNLYQGIFSPDECTVMIALGKATTSGNTIFLKNSDKVGGADLVGPQYYKNKEINVILDIKPNGGPRIMGISAAGTTGLKMGLNDHGVAVGTNISRTWELTKKKVDLTKLRALDRAQLCRDALEKKSAIEASQLISNMVLVNPMATPGNMEFADAKEAIILEGSYDRLAMETIREGVAARSNCFVLLKDLNQWDDISSQARLVRSKQLLGENEGRINRDVMIGFSMDHANGPGPNSICRHGQHFSEEVSLSAATMEIGHENPRQSKISFALGKPCHAWRDQKGHIDMDMSMDSSSIPADLTSGEAWKKFYQEEARD
ncbi:MAG: C45 family autoproteolytic acyltransferase/hydrolase [Candidatus Binatia bacterium]